MLNTPQFLMICRKDSLGYVDFIRGKYPVYNTKYIQNIIDEMTIEEKNKLLTNSDLNFEEIRTLLNFFNIIVLQLCQIPIFLLANSFHGNFSPGSIFLNGAISE